ncbi:MAG: type I glyceraldehyde-3-phosphate dehydrogenase [Candidatus Magasanikbacteria bacterium RIFCSPHIGHO2_01_FULL_41_23]|uniref:Type I glyceraldehyde-3-phosphate dehydrogenase n=1 Tax=Candidatus Magasanikbacteria bacterium RIFCSPLOWO2_01_FULL_40_15 TaxID=1798686 RepID=A0A1F6N4P5_9BACT|nr:MAG: type I glyceraldehyde-3-phosphate dehydrogenase [Candidatus Magasanikbacteria bacterium RIFCSPHIGHO2_01_FULL_41_23]OGH66765.1 MAG: type I glyceraldehyde-3-phosphate dehydrogenase [Candidatus Magasanikbacteria bacterium RIFCSPHIGHO2_02_FULL_41_35]OGH74563.1 MAG: type I glyceraldehyde-3-phosphate dehydrogenase [Candidatus Magasanikbacteria bacterium RIFCSPHIGHO2_12_FULL_41_16]OGH78852.1 MAG: type I glyceraldehyde-3-phosphate dehydrogenase [Candidatus Magasanikbacteria bacterium RIFCSPLOWO2
MLRIAINGFGRIGRHAFKVIQNKKGMEVVAINDLTSSKILAHLLKHDTAYPDVEYSVKFDDKNLIIAGKKIPVFAEKDPSLLPWKKMNVDLVLECTGFFRDEEGAGKHLTAGAKKVIISAPAKGEIKTLVKGVNDTEYKGEKIVNNASCTTNCAAPVMLVLEKEFGIAKAMLTTVHSYTASQSLQDGPNKDLREARAAAQNMIPTSTGAAVAVAQAIPELKGKFDGLSIRVPTITVSLTDITALLKCSVTKEEINEAMKKAEKTYLKNILATTDEELVSSDFIGNPYSAIVDLHLTNVVDGNLVKVVAWYDNEWGYANRLVEMAQLVGKK